MAGIRTLKFLSAFFEGKNLKVSFFGGTFAEKIQGLQILAPSFEKKNLYPLQQKLAFHRGAADQEMELTKLSSFLLNWLIT